MRPLLPLFIFAVLFLCLLGSCRRDPVSASGRAGATAQVEELRKQVVNGANADSILNQWRILEQQPLIQGDSILSARVCYNIARLHAMTRRDSVAYYIERALGYVDPLQGHLEDKAIIYTGMGNMLRAAAKDHQASYYYNKAAAIVLSDSTLDLSVETKSIILLSAAQSNGILYQYKLARQMNFAALALSEELPTGHINRQRVLTQIIQTLGSLEQPADSIAPYLTKLELLHRLHPDDYEISYLYECKNIYFQRTRQTDSILHYQLLKQHRDEELLEAQHYSTSIVSNLLVGYTNVAESYIELRKPREARASLEKAEALIGRYDSLITRDNLIGYKNAAAALGVLEGDPSRSVRLLLEVRELQKLQFETENTQAVAEMNALYQLQAKDRSIQLLNEGMKINQLQLQENRLWLTISVLVAVLLGLTFLFLFYRHRQRRERAEREKLILQQQLLRTQMEPHFIFNTLAAVQSFVRMDKKKLAIKYLNRFSRLLRSSLELSRESLVPLDQEIETLENYLGLQQMRFEDAFAYSIVYPNGDSDFGAAMLPPMLIQPFVENAIVHGIDLDDRNGSVEVEFSIVDDVLQVMITDSGKQASEQVNTGHRSLSGVISAERLKMLGKKAALESVVIAGGGLRVVMTIPLVYG